MTAAREARSTGWADWEVAWHAALYGAGGFYRSKAGPAGHFRTSAHAGDLLAAALLTLADDCGLNRIVDVGAGRGELLIALHRLTQVRSRTELVGSDIVAPPDTLPSEVAWLRSPGGAEVADDVLEALPHSLVIAHELLDDVPCPVVERDEANAWHRVQVNALGDERRAGPPSGAESAWLRRWWPMDAGPRRAEVGLSRDNLWATLVASATGSVLVAVDYSHHRQDRPPRGSLTGYQGGRRFDPIPDGSCDITAHVALDSVAAAGLRAGAVASQLVSQREALQALGIRSVVPDSGLAATDPSGYLAALSLAGQAAELMAAGDLGEFGWLLQSTGPRLPDLAAPSGPASTDERIGQSE